MLETGFVLLQSDRTEMKSPLPGPASADHPFRSAGHPNLVSGLSKVMLAEAEEAGAPGVEDGFGFSTWNPVASRGRALDRI